MSTDVTVIEQAQTALDIRAQVNRIQEVMKEVMIRGTHYGTVPGCGDKPTLLKAGAEKLMMTFRLALDPEVEDLSDAYTRRYRVRTRVTAQSTGAFLGTGVGECASDEEKYAWREAVCREEFDATDPSLRREKWKRNLKAPLLQVHTNPADVANTILKMAKKRSLVDAVLTVTGASDIFTQDIEDIPEEILNRGTSVKGESSTEWHVPNYGPDAGKPFSQVKTEHLKNYLDGAERSILDPKKANFLQKNEAMRDALKLEIEKREVVEIVDAGAAEGEADVPSSAPSSLLLAYKDQIMLSQSIAECSTTLNTALKDETLTVFEVTRLQEVGKRKIVELRGKK